MTHSDHHRPGTTWLVTERTAPAWQAVLDTFECDRWYPLDDVVKVMRDAGQLANRTVENHLASASRRGWINRSKRLVRVIRPDLIQAQLEALR